MLINEPGTNSAYNIPIYHNRNIGPQWPFWNSSDSAHPSRTFFDSAPNSQPSTSSADSAHVELVSQQHGTIRVQSSGCTLGACVSITVKAMYAFSSILVYLNGVRCIAPCSSVAKLAEYHSIQLCQRICLRKRLRALAFLGVCGLMISLIFPAFTAMMSQVTMWPRRAPFATPNTHFAGLRLSCANRHRSKHNYR
mgnify:CR=1 FL=1